MRFDEERRQRRRTRASLAPGMVLPGQDDLKGTKIVFFFFFPFKSMQQVPTMRKKKKVLNWLDGVRLLM